MNCAKCGTSFGFNSTSTALCSRCQAQPVSLATSVGSTPLPSAGASPVDAPALVKRVKELEDRLSTARERIRTLQAKFEDFQEFSEVEAKRARPGSKEAFGRACEAGTMSVIIAELAALVVEETHDRDDRREGLRR